MQAHAAIGNEADAKAGETLVAALADPRCYPHAVGRIQVIETHISWVVLTGEYAYKLKKPLKLPFLDFSTVALRAHYCAEELRLNQPFAPTLYLDVVPIRGTHTRPNLTGTGPVIEHALRMRQFPQGSLGSQLAERGELTPELITGLACDLARFHASAPTAPAESTYGTAACVREQVLAVIAELRPALDTNNYIHRLDAIQSWVEQQHATLDARITARKEAGYVRGCHGDLHLANVVLLEGRLTPFDGIEFNDTLRWIDVVSEAAFTAMDLAHHHRPDLASRFIDAYLDASGDYAAIGLLRFYLVYRALVRAMTHGLRAGGVGSSESAAMQSYLALAHSHTRPCRGAIILMHGLSGSGKSTVALDLVQATGGVRIRSDVERKRLHGLTALACSRSELGAGLYSEDATVVTYARLHALAREIAASGYPAIVDAACLQRAQRRGFRSLARTLGVPFVIVSLQAPPEVLRMRITERIRTAADASEATLDVLEGQLATHEPLSAAESRKAVIVPDTPGWSEPTRAAVLARL